MSSRDRVTPRTRVATHVLLVVTSLTMVAPFLWMALTSFKTNRDIANFPPTWLPSSWRVANYTDALSVAPFDVYFRNSLIISIGHVVLNLVFASLAGYALARYRFRGREAVFLGFVALLMIPTYTKIVPQFLIAKTMPLFGGNNIFGYGGSGWVNTWWGLIIPGAVTPFAVFLFRQFYLSVPHELEDAARIDGLGEWRIWAQIASPLIKPAFVTAGLLTFQDSFNNFLWPLLITTDDNKRVVQLGLSVLKESGEGFTTQWNLLMAGTTMASLPMIVLFLLTQRYFVQGLATTGIK
ncbi:MAG TPA: carbohydrate ABC transporter permease [Pseudonocardia sp.]|jgi:multiple sugar transport system permease protein|uniref:carbohydrate ABC transporter permease n=1 Tax=Pseudonocardia sp. TaxID=60912 RepID=UPI002ED9A8B4